MSPIGASNIYVSTCPDLMIVSIRSDTPSSFLVKLSNCTPSENLYVSQHTTTGTECRFAIMATKAVPARENTEPLECIECAPTRTVDTSLMTEPRAGKRRYVHWMPAADRMDNNRLPAEYLSGLNAKPGHSYTPAPSSIGLESTIITEKSRPSVCASSNTFSTTDDLGISSIRAPSGKMSFAISPCIGQDDITILDFAPRGLLYDLVCHNDPVPDIVIDFTAKSIFCLWE